MTYWLRSSLLFMFAVFIAAFLLALVGQAFAQTSTTTNESEQATTSTRWYDRMFEGESEWSGQERQYIRRWRGERSVTRDRINALPSVAENSVTIPILFGVSLSDLTKNFGDPRSGDRLHQGLDMLAPGGTPIASPTQAVVIRTGYGSSAGHYVYTANPGGETFVYMHLDSIAVGMESGVELTPGQILGFVGNTGNASGGAPHLHFELRVDGEPTDPFSRLQREFSLQEKITSITNYLNAHTDTQLVALLVEEFADDMRAAQSAGLTLPAAITSALAQQPARSGAATATAVSATPSGALPTNDLTIGSDGAAVVQLQQFLIAYNAGADAQYLGRSGATGYFGPITERALAEYQRAVGITPAVGYYGPLTRAHINTGAANENTPIAGSPAGTASTPIRSPDIALFTRDLEYGAEGADVFALQVLLNAHGFSVAETGAGSPGEETQYFGPATERALIGFQKANDITPAVGYFGPITRAVVATL